MLRLLDEKTGTIREVVPAHPRLLRMRARGGTRAYVVADLIRRLAERHHWRVALDSDAGGTGLTERQLLDLNVYPASGPVRGGGNDLEVLTGGVAASRDTPCSLRVAALQANAELHLLDSDADSPDPLALRLVMLVVPYEREAASGREALAAAEAEISTWRALVAEWAEATSAPMPAPYVNQIVAALEDDLDVAGALTILRRLAADDEVSPGARFETFAHLDRLLGLDLARDVGRARAH
jgi:hypothetical protein